MRTAGVRMWVGHRTPQVSQDGTKMSYQKDTEIDKKASKEHEEAKKNSNFTQTYPKGWQRIRELVRDNRALPL